MGIDLCLMPIEATDPLFSHSLLDVDRNYELYDAINALESRTLVELYGLRKFWCFCGRVPDGTNKGDNGYGECKQDAYGEPLRAIPAASLADVFARFTERSNRMRAIWGYLRGLDPNTPIVLYWH